MKTEIIFEDDQILVCRKPAGLATQSSRIGQPDMVSELKTYLKNAAAGKKPGALNASGGKSAMGRTEPYLGIIHRLDQPVEGLLVFAKTKAAAAALTGDLREGTLNKDYYAVTCNQGLSEEGVLIDYMVKNANNVAQIVSSGHEGAKKAVLHYKFVTAADCKVLYTVSIETGRFHQIRAQMAHAGMALLGDAKYADEKTREFSRECGIRNVALCAFQLQIRHPKTGKKMSFVIRPEGEAFRGLLS